MYEQKYNRYKFKYLCLQLQKGGYNPLRTNSKVLADRKKKICDEEDNWKILYTTQKECDDFFTSKVDEKLENDYALSINFTAAAIAVINCTTKNREKGSVDCEDTRIRTTPIVDKSRIAKEVQENKAQHGEASQANLLILKDNAKKDTIFLKKLDKCTADETLQLVASMFLAILHNSTKVETSSIFIKNIESIIKHKIANCKLVTEGGIIRKETETEIIQYYMNVINQINKNLQSLPKFLKKEENKKNLINNAEYTTEKSILDMATDTYTITRTYNDYFKNNLKDNLKYINNFVLMGSDKYETFTSNTFTLPTEGVEKVKGKDKLREITQELKINDTTMVEVTL
jgi:hypothetical protein